MHTYASASWTFLFQIKDFVRSGPEKQYPKISHQGLGFIKTEPRGSAGEHPKYNIRQNVFWGDFFPNDAKKYTKIQ